jgi:hypothetical protein
MFRKDKEEQFRKCQMHKMVVIENENESSYISDTGIWRKRCSFTSFELLVWFNGMNHDISDTEVNMASLCGSSSEKQDSLRD